MALDIPLFSSSLTFSPSPAVTTSAALGEDARQDARQDAPGKEESPPALPELPTDAPCEAETARPDPREGTNNALKTQGVVRCGECILWRRVEGLAWWCGECAATGQRVRLKSKCTL